MSLFSRVKRTLSATDNPGQTDPHAWRLPSAYSTSKSAGKQTVIPNPSIFGNAFIPSEPTVGDIETALAYPDVSHVAVHLALLECFRNLRLSASALDVGVDATLPPAYEEDPGMTPAEPMRLPESQKWDLLIGLAVDRFAAWWSNISSVLNHAMAYTHFGSEKVAVQLGKDYLPPLDVLLVWYAFILDTDAYHAAYRDREPPVPRIQSLCFPWLAIRDLIDMDKMQFTIPKAAQALFRTLSGQSADILTYLNNPPAYTDPGTLPFGINLAAEVKKHESFIDEAHGLLWIRSPALNGSLERASEHYLKFQLTRAAAQLDEQEAPPFGIELLWRTHRLFPHQYALFTEKIRETRPSNDRKPSLFPTLTTSSSITSPNLSSRPCYCWTCERIRDDLPGFAHNPPSYSSSSPPSPSSPSSFSSSPTGPTLPSNPPTLSSLTSTQLHQIQDDLGFYTAVENARRRGKQLPTRPPTAAEKEAERIAKAKQKQAGYRPGLNEYVEVLPDGTRKIRRSKNTTPLGSGSWGFV